MSGERREVMTRSAAVSTGRTVQTRPQCTQTHQTQFSSQVWQLYCNQTNIQEYYFTSPSSKRSYSID